MGPAQTYQISHKSVDDAVQTLSRFFGATPVSGTERVLIGATVHELQLAGEAESHEPVLAVARVKMDPKYGCVLNLQVGCRSPELRAAIYSSIAC